MNYELLVAVASTLGVVVLAFFYAKAAKGAAATETYKRAADYAVNHATKLGDLLAHNEEYTRELEKTVFGSLPAGKLADRLNRMFQKRASGAPGAVPDAVRPAGKAGDSLD